MSSHFNVELLMLPKEVGMGLVPLAFLLHSEVMKRMNETQTSNIL